VPQFDIKDRMSRVTAPRLCTRRQRFAMLEGRARGPGALFANAFVRQGYRLCYHFSRGNIANALAEAEERSSLAVAGWFSTRGTATSVRAHFDALLAGLAARMHSAGGPAHAKALLAAAEEMVGVVVTRGVRAVEGIGEVCCAPRRPGAAPGGG